MKYLLYFSFYIGVLMTVLPIVLYSLKHKHLVESILNAKGVDNVFKAHDQAQSILSKHAAVSFIGLLVLVISALLYIPLQVV